MSDPNLPALPLALVAALARDLEAAGLLSNASRKTIHNGLAELRGSADGIPPANEAAIGILNEIAPAADG